MAAQNRSRNNRPRQAPGRPGSPTAAGKGGTPAAKSSGGGGSAGAPRRLGNQAPTNRPTKSAGAARRSSRRQPTTQRWLPIVAVGVVVIVIATLVIVKLTTNSTPKSSTLISANGLNPPAAPAADTTPLSQVSAATFNHVGTNSAAAAFVVTKGQPPLTSGGKVQFVYEGGEYCPFCAIMRWSLIIALDRLGTFQGLKLMQSASDDGDIPTFSFIGSTYTSKYVTFSPYEVFDRIDNEALQSVPNSLHKLYSTYDGNSSGNGIPPFSSESGIPFLDIGNRYVSSGDPTSLGAIVDGGVLDGGGPGWAAIAQAMKSPNSATGKAISASAFIAEANYLDAAICSLDGGKPASVCASSGVQAAAKVLAAQKRVS